jgi:hypothetical protein
MPPATNLSFYGSSIELIDWTLKRYQILPPEFAVPGNFIDISNTPPVKQNLFHVWTIPDV